VDFGALFERAARGGSVSDKPNGGPAYILVYNRLREEILDTTLKPGAAIFEQDLARRYGVSKSPIRDALLRLKEQNLVEVQSRRGYRVRPISIAEAGEMYEMRLLYERASILRAIDHASEEEIARLRRISDSPATESVQAWMAHNKEFHIALAGLSGNARLFRAASELIDQFDRFTHVSIERLSWPLDFSGLIEEHSAIVDAIDTRDRRLAQKLIKHHIVTAQARTMATLKELAVVG
jgi:GntR family transcriptional regulator, rspAB operon transcriptional repressor